MSFAALAWAYDQRPSSGTHKLVLIVLAHHVNAESGLCCPSQATIADRCIVSERTVRQILSDLEEDGFIKRNKRMTRRGRSSDTFVLLGAPQPAGFAGTQPADSAGLNSKLPKQEEDSSTDGSESGATRTPTPARASGGHARAASLSPERRRDIAREAAAARWRRDRLDS
jgi:DNA-binding transcriptional MocR family regulator